MSSTVCELKKYSSEELAKKTAIDPMIPTMYRIESVTWETGRGDIFTWELVPLDGSSLKYQPGQFNMLYVHGAGEVPISICSSHENGRLLHTTKAVGGVTNKMQQLQPGDLVGVRGPYGSQWPIDEAKAKDVVIMAGGLGLPPLRPVIYYILNHRELFGRVYLLYGSKTPHDLVYKEELEVWQKEGDIDVLVTVDKPEGHWQGSIGVVTDLLSSVSVNKNTAIAMICGPETMMHFSQLALSKMGFDDSQIVISMERNMKCAVGHCGHCQWGSQFICKEGPVFYYDQIRNLFRVSEL